ncbi:acyl-CoA thioesterase [Paenibacillus validus]|uniref:Acyl-CoA thioesterase n=1 Tax=Paenibacillus validus TaxID=44253 RepID=A0A7X2ZEU5_9BACL|nr:MULTISPECIES: acyl-CoA thioesterase [Paenibacillus]MED4601527.1 acyl-CoA thioesterase [Paenibacillus validus]MED4607440.1 acyl-CoA thioesterase [Paenibacillus validus]MUG73596.1 acyl-CoA thioesterase [Paenibacillus validus]
MEQKYVRETRCFKISRVFPPDVNNHNTMFGGKLMSQIDDIASISASKLCRVTAVTASMDSVDFLFPIRPTDSVALESFVTWTGRTSMEIFVKVITEDLRTGERNIAATSFITFVGLDENNKPVQVPQIVPETEEEKKLFETAAHRAEMRKIRREESKKFADYLITNYPWE